MEKVCMLVCRSEANQKWGGNMEHGRGDVNKNEEGAPSFLLSSLGCGVHDE